MTAPSIETESTSVVDLESSRAARRLEKDILTWVKDQFITIKNARSNIENQWYLNLAFYFGKQNVQILKTKNSRLYVPPAPYHRARPVINRVRSTIRVELAQLTGNKPNASIVPASAEDRDMYAAMAGEQIWENLYTDKKLKHKIRRAMWWTLVCGNGFIKTYWDDEAGPIEQEQVMNWETGQPEIQSGPAGDVIYTPETPFHILVPDFREEDIEEQPFVIHAQMKSREWAKMNFPGVDHKSGGGDEPIIKDQFLNLMGTESLRNQQNVMVLEVWVKPGKVSKFPNGAIITVVGDRVVQALEGWPYKHGKYPFVKFDHIPSGKFYNSSLIEDLIPLQREYNRTRGQIIEAKNRMAKPQLIAPRGSVDASKITTEPGLVIFYTPGFDPPQPMPLAPLPQYVLQELDRIQMDWGDIAGQHEVTHGQTPPGVTAATAITYLQERDESRLSPTFDSLEEGIEKMAQMSLSYVQEFWSNERTVRVTGPDGSFDVLSFKGSDLNNNLDIKVEGGSALPTSKAAKQALLMDLMSHGFVDPQQGLGLMDMGGINKLYEQLQVDQRQAQRENLKMSKVTPEMFQKYQEQNSQMMEQDPFVFGEDEEGQPLDAPLIVSVNTFDNHRAHIEFHNRFRKGQAYEQLPEENKILIEKHVQEHIEAMGIETESMDPRMAAGLPPETPEEQQGLQGNIEEQEQPDEKLMSANEKPLPVGEGGEVPGQEMQQPPSETPPQPGG